MDLSGKRIEGRFYQLDAVSDLTILAGFLVVWGLNPLFFCGKVKQNSVQYSAISA